MGNNSFLKLIGKRVKVKYLDEEKTCIVKGILTEANDSFITVNDVVIGLGKNFIICIPAGGKHD
ncbi:unnamed protein product [marine sediment metagenome]|uniref:Uncharacterized protein n=1 Tax=marine sediment metagenome TaxID=412755 RepID=X1KBC7_9ZZZZ